MKAWKLEFEASATVGFKLAFCYLKCREFVKAVDVCEAVLAQVRKIFEIIFVFNLSSLFFYFE